MSSLNQKFQSVSSNERLILQCLSIFWEQITATELYALLRLLDIRNSDDELYTMPSLTVFRNANIARGILRNTKESWGSGFEIAEDKLKEFITRDAMSESWFQNAVSIIQENFNLNTYTRWSGEAYRLRLLRDYRLSIYLGNIQETGGIIEKLREIDSIADSRKILCDIFSEPFQASFLQGFSNEFQSSIIPELIEKAAEDCLSTDQLWEFVESNKLMSEKLNALWVENLILKGKLSEAKSQIASPITFQNAISLAVIEMLEGNLEVAAVAFDSAIKAWRKHFKKKTGYPNSWQMFLYGLALYKTDEIRFFEFADEFSDFAEMNFAESTVYKSIKAVSGFLRNKNAVNQFNAKQSIAKTFTHRFLECLTSAVIPSFGLPVYALDFAASNFEFGNNWVAYEVFKLLKTKENPESKRYAEIVDKFENLNEELKFEPIGNSIPPIEDWERALKSLVRVAGTIKENLVSEAKTNEMRVAWLLNFDRKEIQPVEQKFGKTGWTNGRNIALSRLFELDVKSLTEQDALVVKSAMKRNRDYSFYGKDFFDFEWQKAVAALIGHPNLFLLKNPGVNIQLTKGEPALVVKEIAEDLEISFDTDFTDEGFKVQKETETRYKVLQINREHIEIAQSLQGSALKIPTKGREQLLKAIQMISTKIAIHSELEEHFENLPSVEAENRIHALITPSGDGFHLEFFVKPFGTIPPYFKPGKGNESVIADIEGERTRTKRDLKSERILLDEIENSCPFLAQFESGNYEWNLADAAACLTAMIELEIPRSEGKLVIEWTKGQKLKLVGNVGLGSLSLNVKGNNAWFDISGEVKINEDLVLSMQEVVKLLGNTTNNFIELSDGQFVAITEKLRKHLQSLSAVMDDKNRLHHLRSGILEEFSEELENFKADKAWQDHLEKLKAVKNYVPVLPATFEAELRPYQVEGFEWLSRLANWGVGACLADDMGLGKTLMALAELVERAEKGPALVVAPVSVCRNWVKEAMRFAPTLNFQIFGAGDRANAVEGLGKYDVLVTSYSLLQAEEQLFTSRKFATIVLDEAQAIKNRNTKRSKTVMALQGDFRLITTGTPIENHLGELWNLFNFINPGLLGSHDFFNTKFGSPIEKDNDEDSRKTLQRLIKPFTLRRRKNQVLDDLPAKTEIVLNVEMSPEERAFYESIRRDALQKIEAAGGAAKDKRFQILAELTRLRLACCHPQLVNPNIPLSSSKLELFGETLDELLDNKHKALVFSQFVKHLKIIEEYLQEKGIPYHYLDGSTPAHIRQERIDDFQRGNGEVFLISLKAGGTGLNLTAADYVIHLDPWWNPAVEDQATDRVHRIGQQRPVTVYRLVTENTVEEKILKLHETKRDLADSLLAGTDSSSKLSVSDLLALISEK